LGIRVRENFNHPYLSLTPSIFWTRWHMSLSFWIRDYVFVPLATVRRDPWWPYAALIISMVIFGFWHGANLTFIVWGFYHGLLLVAHRIGQQLKHRMPFKFPHPIGALLSWATTFLLISLSYIFFRANDLSQALSMWRAVLAPRSYSFANATLPNDYYLLVVLMVAGYFLCVGVAQLGIYWKSALRGNLLSGQMLTGRARPGWATLTAPLLRIEGLVAQNKWWWLTPVFVLLLMVTSLSFFGQSSNIAPFIYTLF
jgi:alginate O-acetyltransferase complex protein AlgI